METTNLANENIVNDEQLTLNKESVSYLRTVSGWSKFFAILGFIGSGLLILAGIFSGAIFAAIGNIPGMAPILGAIYIVMGLIYLLPSLYLLKFASNAKNAIDNKNSDILTIALKNLKSCLTFMGIMTIICIVVYPFLLMSIFFFKTVI
jgi:hypothetical protein